MAPSPLIPVLLMSCLVLFLALTIYAIGKFLTLLVDLVPEIGSRIYSFGGRVINRINLQVYANFALEPSSSQIRLVKILPGRYNDEIKCVLAPGSWKRSSYEALSYAWGNAVLVRRIELNGRLFLIPGNLYVALQSLRLENEERTVWIDALSINQRDSTERDSQVQQMRQIYANATKVLVSLGDDSLDIAFAFDYIKHRQHTNSHPRGPESATWAYYDGDIFPSNFLLGSLKPLNATRYVMRILLGHPWWERIWVIQEVAVAQDIEIICGSSSLSWELFCEFVIQNHSSPEEDDYFGHSIFKFLSRGLPELQARPTLEYGLLDLAHEFRSRYATNPRDKLYALLGLMPNADDRGIAPDYSKPVREVYMDFVRSHISQYQSLAILSFAEYRGSQYLPLPTWCPNWTVQGLTPTPLWKKAVNDLDMWLHESQDYYYAAANSKASLVPHADPEILGVKGFVFDRILAVGNVATEPYNRQKATSRESEWDFYKFSSRRRIRSAFAPSSKKFAQWEWEDMACGPWSDRITRHSPYPEESERSTAFYHTLTANIFGDRTIDWSFMSDEMFERGFPGKSKMCRIIDLACMGRRFFVTRRGYMGLAPAGAQKGDLVCILFGANIPFILRSVAKKYRLVGQSYVHGIMAYGDAEMEGDIRAKRIEVQDFLLF